MDVEVSIATKNNNILSGGGSFFILPFYRGTFVCIAAYVMYNFAY